MITLPYPPPELNPNANPHWAKKARTAKKYKTQCHMLFSQHRETLKGQSIFSLVFHPPTAHRRDLDNMVAAMKHGLDALALVAGVDDSKFRLTIAKGEPVKGGSVIVTPLALDASVEAA
jgi:crossover junction endodeoxyribonuclease RusA